MTVSPTGQQPLSTNLSAKLILKDSDGFIAECPISMKQNDNHFTLSFTIHRKLLSDSVLALASRHYIQSKNIETDKVEGIIAVGTVYYVTLTEFIKK